MIWRSADYPHYKHQILHCWIIRYTSTGALIIYRDEFVLNQQSVEIIQLDHRVGTRGVSGTRRKRRKLTHPCGPPIRQTQGRPARSARSALRGVYAEALPF